MTRERNRMDTEAGAENMEPRSGKAPGRDSTGVQGSGRLSKEALREIVEQHLVAARAEGQDPTPTDLYALLGKQYPQIAQMELPKFSGGIVRLVKQRLNNEARERLLKEQAEAHMLMGDLNTAKDRLRLLLLSFGHRCVRPDSVRDRMAVLSDIDNYVEGFFAPEHDDHS